jgi:replicative DNA helicase
MGKQTTKALPTNDHLTDPEAEQAVLGAILLRPDALYDVTVVVQPETFYREDHRLIYRAMLDLSHGGQAVDLVTVTARLKDLDILGRVGGAVFLADLSEHVGTAANVVHYANRVRDKALIRKLRDAALQIASTCEQPCLSAKELMDRAEAQVYEKCRHPGTGGGPQAIEVLVEREAEVLAEIHQTKKPPGLATGYLDLDRFMSWGPGDLAVLAGRTSMGKTSLALNLALKLAQAGASVGFFSLEMSQEQITRRLLAIHGKIDATRLNRVRLSGEEWVALYQAKDDLMGLPLWIDGTPSLSVMEVRSGARRARAKGELDFLVVDYLQLVRPYRRGRTREEEVAETCRGLKSLAGELGIPILAVAQPNRKLEERPNKRPKLSDLRESGAIEQDADTVMFIYRDEVYHENTLHKGVAEIILGKQRNGRTGTVKLAYRDNCLRFDNYQENESF